VDFLCEFVRKVESDVDLQRAIRVCSSPAEIERIAEDLGVPIVRQQLRDASSDLCAPWWPWAEKGSSWRRAFFER
jgi:hypothetical protein